MRLSRKTERYCGYTGRCGPFGATREIYAPGRSIRTIVFLYGRSSYAAPYSGYIPLPLESEYASDSSSEIAFHVLAISTPSPAGWKEKPERQPCAVSAPPSFGVLSLAFRQDSPKLFVSIFIRRLHASVLFFLSRRLRRAHQLPPDSEPPHVVFRIAAARCWRVL